MLPTNYFVYKPFAFNSVCVCVCVRASARACLLAGFVIKLPTKVDMVYKPTKQPNLIKKKERKKCLEMKEKKMPRKKK